MTHSIRCTALARYDHETQNYVSCGEEVTVPADWNSSIIQCPACGNSISLLATVQTPRPAAQTPRPSPKSAKETAKGAPAAKPTATHKSASKSTSAASSSPLDALHALANFDDLSPSNSPTASTDLLAIDAAIPIAASVLSASPLVGKPCRFCGTRLQTGMIVCPKCGGTRKAIWSDDIPLDKMKIVPAGCQRSAGSLLGRGLSAKQLVITVGVLIGVMAVMSILVLLVAGPLALGIGVTVYALVGVAFYLVVHHSFRIANVPGARLTSWQRILWGMAGKFIAAQGWRVRGAAAGSERLQVHEKSFSDADLLTQPDLTKINVLVLTNTKITDEGLKYLRGLHQLRYLYVQGTQVTDEGVFRLQQTIPLCWIWW